MLINNEPNIIKALKRIFPFIRWFKHYSGEYLKSDIISGVTVALVLIPQSMAYAQLANLPAYYGLYASFLPPMVASLFGSSRQLATGPVAIVSLMTATALEPIATAGSDMFVAYAVLLALIVGLFQFFLGFFRLGLIVNFLSHPVVNGFTNAAALIIASTQLSKIFGVTVDKTEHTYQSVYFIIIEAFTNTHLPSIALAILALIIMYGLKKMNPRIPYVLIAVIITTFISWGTGFEKKIVTNIKHISCPSTVKLLNTYNQLFNKLDSLSEKRVQLNSFIVEVSGSKTEESIFKEITLKNELSIITYKIKTLKEEINQYQQEISNIKFRKFQKSKELFGFCSMVEKPSGIKYEVGDWHLKIKFQKINFSKIVFSGGGEVVGDVPKGLPGFKIPQFDWMIIFQLIPMALIITLLGFMEAISIAKSMAAKTKQQLDPNQELIGQGLANMIGSLFNSYPISGSFSRSAVNIQSGAVSGISSVFTSAVVLLTLLYFTPLLYFLPQSVLASIIILAVIGLLNISGFIHAWKAQKYDGMISIFTFLLTLYFAPDLDLGIMIGVGASLLWFLLRNTKPVIAMLSKHPDGTFRNRERFGLRQCKYIAVIRYHGSLFFANENYLEKVILQVIENMPELKHIILVGNGINELDASGENLLSDLIDRIRNQGIGFSMTGLNDNVVDTMKRTFLYDKIGEEHLFRNLTRAIDKLHPILHKDSNDSPCPLQQVAYADKSEEIFKVR